MSLDVIFVNVGRTKKRVYQELSKDYSAIEPPFWAALTAGFIRKKGFNVNIIDANAENLTHEETAKIIEEKKPKISKHCCLWTASFCINSINEQRWSIM